MIAPASAGAREAVSALAQRAGDFGRGARCVRRSLMSWHIGCLAIMACLESRQEGSAVERSRTNVLAGIDFSDGAKSALREARLLARGAGLERSVHHSTEPERLACRRTCAGMVGRGVSRDGHGSRPGGTAVARDRTARAGAVGIGRAVVGSHGASGFQAMPHGRRRAGVALMASCPVLFASRRNRHRPSDQALAAYRDPVQEHP